MDIIQLKKEVLEQMDLPWGSRDTTLISSSVPNTWLNDQIADFAAETLVYNSEGLVSMKETMSVCSEEVKAALVILYNWKRGDFITGTMTDNPRLAGLTPLFMYAHKLHHNIPYEKWDKKDPLIDFALGKTLAEAMKFKDKFKPPLTTMLVNEYRKIALTTKTTGIMNKTTAYKFNTVKINHESQILAAFGRILLQTWIANVNVRLEDVMILDLRNWDRVPKAFDVKIEQPEKAEKSPRNNRDFPRDM